MRWRRRVAPRVGWRGGRRSRRRGSSRRESWASRFVVLPVGLAIVATHPARSPVTAADLGRPYERVQLRTSDGLSLAAWYVPSRSRAAVIAFPGRTGPVRHARLLARAGYGVLLL